MSIKKIELNIKNKSNYLKKKKKSEYVGAYVAESRDGWEEESMSCAERGENKTTIQLLHNVRRQAGVSSLSPAERDVFLCRASGLSAMLFL